MPTYARRSQRAGPSRSNVNDEESASRQRARVQQTYGGSRRSRADANQSDEEEDVDEDEGSAEEEEEEEEEDAEAASEEDGNASEGEQGERRAWQVQKKYFKLSISEATRKLAETKDQGDLKRKANDLVRLALFSEHRRAPLRREDITSKILGKEYQRLYPVIFNRAQSVLRHTFGYQMVELRARGTDNEQIVAAQSRREHRTSNADEQEKKKNVSKSYMIVSTLPPALIARVTRPNPSLQEAFEGTDANGRDPSGVLVDWQKSDAELGSTGLTFLILSLILVHERVLTDDQLRSFLRRLSLKPGAKLPTALQPRKFTPSSRNGDAGITIEDFLDLLTKQSYLERILVQTVPRSNAALEASLQGRRTQARGNLKRTRNSNGASEHREEFEWRWGARAEAEISEKAVADFIADVFVSTIDGANLDYLAASDDESDGEEAADGAADTEGAQRRKRLKKQTLRDVERAAGSMLIV